MRKLFAKERGLRFVAMPMRNSTLNAVAGRTPMLMTSRRGRLRARRGCCVIGRASLAGIASAALVARTPARWPV